MAAPLKLAPKDTVCTPDGILATVSKVDGNQVGISYLTYQAGKHYCAFGGAA